MFNVIPEILYPLLRLVLPFLLLFTGTSYAALDYSAQLVETQEAYTGLSEVYQDYFPIGAAVMSWQLDDPDLVDFILKNFKVITPEYELKEHYLMDNSQNPANWGNFNPDHLACMDRLAAFAQEHGLKIHGHTLVWPVAETWMLWTDVTQTTLVSKEVFLQRLDEYIGFIMMRYGDESGPYGKVIDVWDVVNEPFHYDRKWELKQETKIFQICGEDFAKKAFEFAAKYAKEDDILMVNETFVEGNVAKTNNMFNCVARWKSQGLRIDAVGSQGHMGTVSTKPFDPNFCVIDDLAKRCRDLNIKLGYTEIDIKVWEIDRQKTVPYETPPKWLETWQIFKYQKFFEAMRRNKDVMTGATFWGLDDAHSVITYGPEGTLKNDWPLLFDRNGLPKQSFFAVCDF